MDSPESENLYENNINNESSKISLIDSAVQLELIDNSSKSETELIQNLPNNFVDIDMKMPITIQNCVPLNLQVSSELVVIANNGTHFINEPKVPLTTLQTLDANEALNKRFCIEQDGRTYIVSLQDGTDGLAGIVELRNKNVIPIENQLIETQENYSHGAKQGINQNWFTSRAEKTTLHNKGHVWKQGMWGKEEVELLENNIKTYCEEHDITNPATIIFEMSKDERKDFYRTVAKGLNRPLFSVYRRVIRMYDNKNHVGKYTTEELEKLKKLRSTYGNNWQAIGTAMGRSASSIKDRCRLMKDNCNQGKWLLAEEKRLAEAVYDLADAYPGEKISSGLSWAVVAERVGTRSEKQCRTKWLNYLNWKEAGGTDWTREDDVVLICKVCTLSVADENHVDWAELAKGWSSVRSPQWLRGKWWNLKRHVPHSNLASFQEICEYLYKLFVLKIQVKEEQDEDDLPDNNLSLQSAPLITQPKTILHTIQAPATPAGIVVSNVSPTLACSASVSSIPTTDTINVGPMIQTLEVLPQNMQLTTNPHAFLSTTHPAQTVPLATTLAPNQIIIHAVTAEALHENSSIVQINPQTEIIVNPSSPATLTSLASTQVPSPPSSPSGIEQSPSDMMEDETFETEVVEENILDDESESLGKNDPASHIILSDPMLTAQRSPLGIEKECLANTADSEA